ncbi:MAG: shikimate dehydrogenase [Anaerolineae bacterium]|nr:MAG: shikimate dehydrogenase [Anaerolineae bacterium]
MKRIGIIGWPVEHSLSPVMHNAAFAALGLSDWHYERLPTPKEELVTRIENLIKEGFVGANVTVPHKQAVMPLLNNITLAARGIGAVNTIVIEEGRTEGYNTDSPGFMLDLAAQGVEVAGKRVLVLGAGGSAHAVVLGLANGGAHVTVVARRDNTAWELRNAVRRGVSKQLEIEVQSLSALPKIAPTVEAIVNTTPVGMWPNVDESLWPDEVPIPSGVVIYDLIYRPMQTKFMRQAEAAGARAIGGLGMLVYQGAAAFELWTGQQAPADVMRAAALEALK